MRLLGKTRVLIDESSVIEFFDRRARSAADAAAPGVTMLQDSHAAIVEQRDRIETEALSALLAGLPPAPRTLDVGCGAGRLYFALRQRLGPYVGVDGSPGLIAAAQGRGLQTQSSARFAVHDLGRPGLGAHWQGEPPQLVLMCGIAIYLNDDTLARLVEELAALLTGPCLIVLREPVGITDRLSLKEHWSEELKARYSAIYRTRDEFLELFKGAFGARPMRWNTRWLFDETALNNRVETRQALMTLEIS